MLDRSLWGVTRTRRVVTVVAVAGVTAVLVLALSRVAADGGVPAAGLLAVTVLAAITAALVWWARDRARRRHRSVALARGERHDATVFAAVVLDDGQATRTSQPRGRTTVGRLLDAADRGGAVTVTATAIEVWRPGDSTPSERFPRDTTIVTAELAHVGARTLPALRLRDSGRTAVVVPLHTPAWRLTTAGLVTGMHHACDALGVSRVIAGAHLTEERTQAGLWRRR